MGDPSIALAFEHGGKHTDKKSYYHKASDIYFTMASRDGNTISAGIKSS